MATCAQCSEAISDSAKICPYCRSPQPDAAKAFLGVLMLAFLVVAAIGSSFYVGLRNLVSIHTLRDWGSGLYFANIKSFESDVYLVFPECKPEDRPYIFASIPSSFDDAKSGRDAIGMATQDQLFIRHGAVKIDGVEWLALEATLEGAPFRGWLRAKSCDASFRSLDGSGSSLFAPFNGPWIDESHMSVKNLIVARDGVREAAKGFLRKEIDNRKIEIKYFESKDVDERGLLESNIRLKDAVNWNYVFQWEPIIGADELEQWGFINRSSETLISKSSVDGFVDAVKAAEAQTLSYLLVFRGQVFRTTSVNQNSTEDGAGLSAEAEQAAQSSEPKENGMSEIDGEANPATADTVTSSERSPSFFIPIQFVSLRVKPEPSVVLQLEIESFYGEDVVRRIMTHQSQIEEVVVGQMNLFRGDELASTDVQARLANTLKEAINAFLIKEDRVGGVKLVIIRDIKFQT